MSSKSWFAKRSSRANESRRSRTERKSRPAFDTLEDRSVPAIIISHVAAPTPSNNDFTVFANAMSTAPANSTVEINGTLDWSEPNAFSSWASTGFAFAMPHVNGITLEAMTAGSGIKGPGTEGGEAGPIYFDGLGTDQSWNITGLTIKNFDVAIFYSQETNVSDFSGTHVTDNTITVPNATPGGTPNGGIILGPSPNQVVQGNLINITGNGGATASSFGIDAFTYPGAGAWNNLLIDNNTVTVTTVGASEKIIGFAENTGSTGSNITVTNDTFNGDAGSTSGNQQVAFGITSDSTATATVVYSGDAVHGALDGFVWGDPESSPPYDFSNDIGITFSDTTITNVSKGFVARDGAKVTVGGDSTISNSGAFSYGTAFSADGAGTVITVTDPVSNFYTGTNSNEVMNLKSETNGGLVNFTAAAAGIQSVSKAEGNVGFTLFSFPVTLDAPPDADQEFTVNYATANGTADGNEYLSTQGTLTFLPGQSSATIAVRVIGNYIPQPDLTFFVNLTDPTLYTFPQPVSSYSSPPSLTLATSAAGNLSSTQATGTVLNDDSTTLSASISNASITKSSSLTSQLTFPAMLNSAPAAGQYYTVNYATSNAGSGSGFAGPNDYQGTSGTLTFLAGSTTPVSPLTVPVYGNTQVNPNEIFDVTLTTPLLHFTGTNQTIPANVGTATATGTIISPAPTGASVSINSVSATPMASGSTLMTFTITLTGTITSNIKVYYSTASAGSGAGYATGNQYQSTSGIVTFTPTGSNTATVTVTIYPESTPLPVDEIFDVKLTNPLGQPYVFGTSTGVGTIDT
jgi:Calx-beta domain